MFSRRIGDLNLREILHRLRAEESDRKISREIDTSQDTVKNNRQWLCQEARAGGTTIRDSRATILRLPSRVPERGGHRLSPSSAITNQMKRESCTGDVVRSAAIAKGSPPAKTSGLYQG